jgi:nucleoside-diphosphate-sugar epimerase
MPRPLLPLLAAVNPTLRAVAYQLEQPFVVDHTKFARAFGAQPTPKDEAIRQTVAWYRVR